MDTTGTSEIRLTPNSIRIIRAAHQAAHTLQHCFVGTEHLLLAILDSPETVFEIKKHLTFNEDVVRDHLMEAIKRDKTPPPSPGNSPVKTPRVTKVLWLSNRIARHEFAMPYVTPIHLFLGLLSEGDGVAARVLKKQGLRYRAALEAFPGTGEEQGVGILPGSHKLLEVVKAEKFEGKNGLALTIKIISVNTEPPVLIYTTELSSPSGVWPETFSSVEGLNGYLRGLCSMASVKGEVLLWPKNIHCNLG